MSQLSDVESLLLQLTAEGELSSRGGFTLDPGRSRQKIAHYLQSDSASWSYGWVRSMVGLGAEAGTIQLGRQLLLLSFSFPSPSPGLESLREFLHKGHEQEGLGPLRNSLLWIQALLELQSGLQFSLLLEDPNQSSRLWEIGREQLQGAEFPSSALVKGATVSLTVRGEAGALLALRTALAARLPERLSYASIPILLDGRALNPVAPDKDLLYARYYLGRSRMNGLCLPPPGQLPAHEYEVADQWFRRPRLSSPPSVVTVFSLAGQIAPEARWSLDSGQPLLSWNQAGQTEQLHMQGGPDYPLASWGSGWQVPVALFRGNEGADQVRLIDHGVALDPQHLPLNRAKAFGWLALVARSGVQTDLSGLKPVHNEEYERLIEWLLGEVLDIHRALKWRRS